MIEHTLFAQIPRPAPGALDGLRGLGVADLFDEMDPDDRDRRLMRGDIRPRAKPGCFSGPAVTVEVPAGDNLMVHAALHVARAGDVLVISNGGIARGALWGENVSVQARVLGLAGVVVDGPVRDSAALRDIDFPVHASILSVSKATKEKVGRINMPMTCGDVTVRPGDIVIGDDDGIIVVPPERIAELAFAARQRANRALALRDGIERGRSMYEQLGTGAILASLGVGFVETHWRDPRPSDSSNAANRKQP
ncbi:MAG: RraA family protein [Lautropia sp.]